MAFHSSRPKTHPQRPWANSKRQFRQNPCPSVAILSELIALSSLNAARHHKCLSLMDCYCEQFLQAAVNSSLRHFHTGGALLNKQCVYPTSTYQHSKRGKNYLCAQWKQQRCRRQRGRKWMRKLRQFHIWASMEGEMRVVTGWDYCKKGKRWTRNDQQVSLAMKAAVFIFLKTLCHMFPVCATSKRLQFGSLVW